MIFIVGRCCVFPYNNGDAVLTRISHMIYITCPKMGDGILTSLQLGLIQVSYLKACIWLSQPCRSSFIKAITASFPPIVETNFRTSHGKTVSTIHFMKCSVLSLLHLQRKQWGAGSFNKTVSGWRWTFFIHPLHVYHGVSQSHFLLFWNESLHDLGPIFFIVPHGRIYVLRNKVLTYIFDVKSSYVFVVKIE